MVNSRPGPPGHRSPHGGAVHDSDGPVRRTQASRRARAEECLLEAAIQVIGDKGLEGFTLAEVGVAAGYSSGLTAHYFRKKDLLLEAVAAQIITRMRQGVVACFIATPGLQGLIAGATYFLDQAETWPQATRAFLLVAGEALQKPELKTLVADLSRTTRERLVDEMELAAARKEIRKDLDLEMEAFLLLGTLRGVLQLWLTDPDAVRLADLRAAIAGQIQERLATRP